VSAPGRHELFANGVGKAASQMLHPVTVDKPGE